MGFKVGTILNVGVGDALLARRFAGDPIHPRNPRGSGIVVWFGWT